MSVAGEGWTEPNIYFSVEKNANKSLLLRHKKPHRLVWFFVYHGNVFLR